MTNSITLMGRLTRDPVLRHTQAGLPVASFTLACDRDYKDANGEKQTDFVDCVAWRGTAELINKYLRKGRMAVVSGRLQLRDWTDRDGNKRRSAEVLTSTVSFADSKQQEQNTAQKSQPAAAAPAQFTAPAARYAAGDDELPF